MSAETLHHLYPFEVTLGLAAIVGLSTIPPSYSALKQYLLIFIARIFDSRVDGGIPSLTAAHPEQQSAKR